jgi:hypothetical protein
VVVADIEVVFSENVNKNRHPAPKKLLFSGVCPVSPGTAGWHKATGRLTHTGLAGPARN